VGSETTLKYWKVTMQYHPEDPTYAMGGAWTLFNVTKYNPGGNRHAPSEDIFIRIYYQEYTGAVYTITIKWYDDPAAGSLLRTDTLAVNNGELAANLRSLQVNSPATAESFEVIVTASAGDDFYTDDIQVKPVGFY